MATGHIRRIAPINQDRTRSGVSRFMNACKYTFIHQTCQAVFSVSAVDAQVKVGRNEPCPCGRGKNSKDAAESQEPRGEPQPALHERGRLQFKAAPPEAMPHSRPTHALF